MQNVLAEHEMFEKFGGGKTSKQEQVVKIISCQADKIDQFRQAFTYLQCSHRAAMKDHLICTCLKFNISTTI